MGSKHTLEPWQRDEKLSRVIFDSNGISIGSMYTNEDVHRVLCCVNACAGIDNPSALLDSNRKLREDLEYAISCLRNINEPALIAIADRMSQTLKDCEL